MRWDPIRRPIYRAGVLMNFGFMAMFAGSAHANPVIVASYLSPPISAAISVANMHCSYITYDKNGNRLSQADVSVTSTPIVWGAGTYGCFTWSE